MPKRTKWTNERLDIFLKNRNMARLGDVIKGRIPVKIKCLVDNHEWNTSPDTLVQNHKCPKCVGRSPWTNSKVDEILRSNNRQIVRIGEVVNNRIPIKWKCMNQDCNGEWSASIDGVINKQTGCRKCSKGKSEKLVWEFILKYSKYTSIHPWPEHKYFIIKNRKRYPDFYMMFNDKQVIIERHGEQHYEPRIRIQRSGLLTQDEAEKNFIDQQNKDRELREYCFENDIFLLEIPYWWKENKIVKELKKLNSMFS